MSHDVDMNALPTNITALPTQHDHGIALWLIALDAHTRRALPVAELSLAEQARASRFHFERDARRYQASHAALRLILGQVTGASPSTLQFCEGSHGKPYLKDTPGLHFNMSHSDDWALIGVSMLGPIGIDIEVMTPMDDTDLLAQKNFSAAEYAAFKKTPPDQRLASFLRCWTRKEACLKALGSGLSIEPHEFEAGVDTGTRDTAIAVNDQSCAMTVFCIDLPIAALAAGARLNDPHSPLAM